MCQSKLTVLVHKDFRQALASHQYREWVSPIVSLVDFPNLHCVICQEVMDDTGMVITKGTVGVIPYGIEAKHLGGRGKKKQTNMDQNHLLVRQKSNSSHWDVMNLMLKSSPRFSSWRGRRDTGRMQPEQGAFVFVWNCLLCHLASIFLGRSGCSKTISNRTASGCWIPEAGGLSHPNRKQESNGWYWAQTLRSKEELFTRHKAQKKT